MNSSERFGTNIIEIYDLEEFIKYAKSASLVIYDPEYFPSPFLDEQKIKSINCYAIGVNFHGLPVILKYQKSKKNSNFNRKERGITPKDIIDASMRSFINEIKNNFNAIKGSIPGEKRNSIWDDVFIK